MNIYSGKGPIGAGAGFAAILILEELVAHLRKSGALIPADIEAIRDATLQRIPDMTSAQGDARQIVREFAR